MKFRPCIDIHNGKVKQIVGGSLRDAGDFACVNFVSSADSTYYAELFKKDGIKGAHVIILNKSDSEYYEATKDAAFRALEAYPGGLQIGGGVNADNALEYIQAGASHVIVTSFVFKDGKINYSNMEKLVDAVGKEHIVLDLSCGIKDGKYYVVTDRWQKFSDEEVTPELFEKLSDYCDEFLVHGVDSEGKRKGVNSELIELLSKAASQSAVNITYAGGIASMDDIEEIKKISNGKLDVTVGSALDLYGGNLKYSELIKINM